MRQIESDRFDAIFSDLSAPKIDGLALLRRLRIRSPELPVISCSTRRTTAREPGIEAGHSDLSSSRLRLKCSPRRPPMRFASGVRGAYRGLSGERPEPVSVSATDAKNVFGRILEKAIQGGRVVITKHDVPKRF